MSVGSVEAKIKLLRKRAEQWRTAKSVPGALVAADFEVAARYLEAMKKAIQEALELGRPVMEKDEYMRRKAEKWAELVKMAREGHDKSRERERLDGQAPMVFDLSDLPRAMRLLQKALGKRDN